MGAYRRPAQRSACMRRQREKAETFLRSASHLASSQDWKTAISRAYYTVYHRILTRAVSMGADPALNGEEGMMRSACTAIGKAHLRRDDIPPPLAVWARRKHVD